jgi:hypothetical protein
MPWGKTTPPGVISNRALGRQRYARIAHKHHTVARSTIDAAAYRLRLGRGGSQRTLPLP